MRRINIMTQASVENNTALKIILEAIDRKIVGMRLPF